MTPLTFPWSSQQQTFSAVRYGAHPDSRPAILVLHGGAGPTPHEHDRASRLAAEGYVAVVPDLFGRRFTSREDGVAVIQGLVTDVARLRVRLADAIAAVRSRPEVDASRVAVLGFCFGGLCALEIARSGADVRAAVSLHGGLTTAAPARGGEVRARIFVGTGGADPFVTREHRGALEAELTDAGARWEMAVYGGAQHGFTEDGPARPGCAYDADADASAWAATRRLLAATLG